jgi:hypothetical protein
MSCHSERSEESASARSAPSKVCHSERSEESALVRLEPELQILRSAQDDSNLLSLLWVGRGPVPTQDDSPLRSG